MTPKIKDKKLLCHIKSKIRKLFGRNCVLDNFITRKFELHGIFLWIKDPDPDPVFSRIRIRIQVTKKDRIRPDPDPDPTGSGSGSATLVKTHGEMRNCYYIFLMPNTPSKDIF